MERTLLIALDGATFDLLDPLMEAGVMPQLRALVERGCRGVLESTPHPLTPPAFTSMMTGRSPGNHGIYDFTQVRDEGQTVRFPFYDSRDIRCETIWSLASRMQREVHALNFVMTAPVEPINGAVLPGMMQWKLLKQYVYPTEFYETLRSFDWFDPKTLCWDFARERQVIGGGAEIDKQMWVQHHIDREQQWFNIVNHLLEQESGDLLAVVLDGSDKIQHICWEELDPDFDPPGDGVASAAVLERCHDYFRSVDAFLAQALDIAGEDARLFLVSDHGFGPSWYTLHVNQLLSDLGHLVWREAPAAEDDALAMHLPVDWDRTSAFVPRRSLNGIFIRIAGQDGGPGVPAAEYDAFRASLVQALMELRHPQTGERVVQDVLLKEETFAGLAMADAPDLTIVPADHGFISTARSDVIVEPHPAPIGTHYPDGIWIAAGPGIAAGGDLGRLSILDVAPTVLHSLGLPVPTNLEGRVVEETFSASFLEARPIRRSGLAGEGGSGEGDRSAKEELFSDEEREAVIMQLRALGYME